MTVAGFAVVILAVAMTATEASAQSAYVRPPVVIPGQTLLGFTGHVQYGYGMVIDRVWPGSLAESAGLENGDVIVRINGVRIYSHGQYLALLDNANGYVVLHVDDVNGRGIVRVPVRLGNSSGPVAGYYRR
jgi:S1-C subfamily serine protease